MLKILTCAAIVAASLCCEALQAKETIIYVASKSTATPPDAARCATIEDALQRAKRVDECRIILADGVYNLKKGVVIAPESGFAKDAKLTIAAENFGKAALRIEREVSKEQMVSVSDKSVRERIGKELRGVVKEIDMKSMGIDVKPFATLFTIRDGFPELIYNGTILPLSRYPNKGYMQMKRVIDNFGTASRGGIFEYSDARHSAWKGALEEGVWFTGYWRVPWQSHTVRISDIDTVAKRVTHAIGVETSNGRDVGAFGGIGSKYKRPEGSGDENYYVNNLVEEIDQPGEWCIDFKRNKIYIYPPKDFKGSGLAVLSSKEPLVKIKDVSGVTIEGLVLEHTMGNGVEILRGSDNAIKGCTVRNVLGHGVLIDGGERHTLLSCDITDVGRSGAEVYGGNRVTLTRCDHLIENNYISRVGTIQQSWAPAVKLGRYNASGGDNAGEDAVGIIVRHNMTHDLPHSAFLYVGNLHLFEHNESFDVAKLTGDVGVYYSRTDWTSRGNVLRYNMIHHSPRANGTYHDDGHAGDSVYNNLIHSAISGTLIGGGHDNYVSNNLYINCKNALSVDARGASRNYKKSNPKYSDRFRTYKIAEGNWKRIFPEMESFLERDSLELPHGNYVGGNFIFDSRDATPKTKLQPDMRYSTFEPNKTVTLTAAQIDRMIIERKADGALPKMQLESCGLYKDKYRTVLPDRKKIISSIGVQGEGFDSTKDIQATNKATKQ